MSNIATQRQAIRDIESVQYITGALRDISAVQLSGLRDRFLKNTLFFDELRALYRLVWRIATVNNRLSALEQSAKGTLYIAYTTNKHFYGSLNADVMQAFLLGTSTKDEVCIIGSTGKGIWGNIGKKRKSVSYVSFADAMPNTDEIRDLLVRITPFAHVYVFYPGFLSVHEQKATNLDITFRPSAKEMEGDGEALPQYFLEPDLVEMFSFFNTQIRYMLLERMLLETQLSQVAARLVRMDMADHSAGDILRGERIELRRAHNTFASGRMLETVVGYIQWHNTTT
jgi:F0F1-type ATP synthase gamma subunit